MTYAKAENVFATLRQIQERYNVITEGMAFKNLTFDNIKLCDWAISRNLTMDYKEKAFNHAERLKLMRMRGGMSFNPILYNIPKQYFERENQLRTEIVNLTKKINEQGESEDWKNQLYSKTIEFNTLMTKLKTDYPQYYKLKYNSEPASLRYSTRSPRRPNHPH